MNLSSLPASQKHGLNRFAKLKAGQTPLCQKYWGKIGLNFLFWFWLTTSMIGCCQVFCGKSWIFDMRMSSRATPPRPSGIFSVLILSENSRMTDVIGLNAGRSNQPTLVCNARNNTKKRIDSVHILVIFFYLINLSKRQ